MKKVLIYFFAFLFICFILPALFTSRTKNTSVVEENTTNKEESKEQTNNQVSDNNSNYEYKNYGTIKLLHSKTGEVEEVSMDEYLCNVVSAEMPADYEVEALKAQGLVARTYTVFKILNKKHENTDICDDFSCCQAWISKEDRLAKWEEQRRKDNWQKIVNAVEATKGKIVTYDNQPINAFFHSNSGGTTELPINVWGGSGYPYLQVVQTDGEEGYTQYSSEAILTQEELIEKLKPSYQDIQINFEDADDIKILEYTDGSRVKTIKFGNHNLSGVEARTLLGLRSTSFEMTKQDGKIKFSVKGYGHGVGMSQTGANTMAKQGKNCEEIIKHFYIGVEIKDINSL